MCGTKWYSKDFKIANYVLMHQVTQTRHVEHMRDMGIGVQLCGTKQAWGLWGLFQKEGNMRKLWNKDLVQMPLPASSIPLHSSLTLYLLQSRLKTYLEPVH